MLLSVIIPLYNEAANIRPLLASLQEALLPLKGSYELILIDDGSRDDSVDCIRALAGPEVKLIVFHHNHGQTAALAAGIYYAKGRYLATLDGDLQNDPQDIIPLLNKCMAEDWDLVAGHRRKRQDNFWLRKIPSRLANRLIGSITGVHLHDYGCALKVFRAELGKNLGLYGELHRFIPVLARLQGARMTEEDVRHHARTRGKSHYGLGRSLRVLSDLLLMLFFQKFAQKPMHLFGTAGLLSAVCGGLMFVYLLIEKLLGHEIWGRPLLILAAVLLLGGIQLITLGFIAETVMRTYFESQRKTPFRVKEIFLGTDKALSTT